MLTDTDYTEQQVVYMLQPQNVYEIQFWLLFKPFIVICIFDLTIN